MKYRFSQSEHFLSLISKLTDEEIELIGNFQVHFMQHGFAGLPGRNKPSTGVSKKHANRIKLIQYAIINKLHHYHIGYDMYDETNGFGDWTSKFVVHYQNFISENQTINLIDYAPHPPFKLPKKQTLTVTT